MALLPNENEWDTRYDKFLVLGSWIGAAYYAVPVAIILAVCRYTQVAEELWIPVLIIYFIGAVAHQLNHGSMALNIQIKTSAGWTMEQIMSLMRTLREK